MKIQLSIYIFSLICFINASAQDKRVLLEGVVKHIQKPIKDVHIVNLTSNKGSLSNKNGFFQISVKENDTLKFTDIQFETVYLVIDKTHLLNKTLTLQLKPKINVLDEIELKEKENMAGLLGLPNADKEILNKLERKLNYYSQKSAPMVFLDALILSPILNRIPFVKPRNGGIEDIYYLISGERKTDRKLKKLIDEDIVIETNQIYIEKIRAHFQDDFFIQTLHLEKNEINPFINYCLSKNIIFLYDKKRYLDIINIFLEEIKTFNPE